MRIRLLLVCALFATGAIRLAAEAPNPVITWAHTVQPAVLSAGSPGTAQILHTMTMLAIYDAVVAIEGGYEPYAAAIQAPPGADVRAAVAAAAYRTARPRVTDAQKAYLDLRYAEYLGGLPDGPAKTAGISVGEQAAAAILALRQDDGFGLVVPYACSAVPPAIGEFEPNAGCPASPGAPQPVDVKVGGITPFTYSDPRRFRPDGPDPLTSSVYAEEFAEVRDYGRAESVWRSAAQTDLAFFWAEHPYLHWNRNITSLAAVRGLSTLDTARFFAMVHTAASDAVIAGFAAKYHYRSWRPRTAIPLAALDGNPDTDPDPSWTPLLSVNHPEYPSGHGFWSTAVVDAAAAFFGTNRITWTLVTSKEAVPRLVQTERTYYNLNLIMKDVEDARVWAGLHFRHSMRHGAQIGRRVAAHVTRHHFRPAHGGGR